MFVSQKELNTYRSFSYMAVLALAWAVALLNGTSLGSVYQVMRYAKYAVVAVTFYWLLSSYRSSSNVKALRKDVFLFASLAILFFVRSYIAGQGTSAIDYLWVYCLVFLIGQMRLNAMIFRWIGWIYGLLGLVFLLIYRYGTALSGWNPNSVAMIGMHSFLVFLIQFYQPHKPFLKVLLVIAGVFVGTLIGYTDARSSILFAIVGTLFAIGLLPRRMILLKGRKMWILLLAPLVLAIIVVLIAETGLVVILDEWSMEHFDKIMFSGRDVLWNNALEAIADNPLFGNGRFNTNWHNCAMSALVAYGCVGFVLWLGAFYRILKEGNPYFDDYLVAGSFAAFIVLYFQQSLELGLLTFNPSLLPYVILGMMLGRVRFLKERNARPGLVAGEKTI